MDLLKQLGSMFGKGSASSVVKGGTRAAYMQYVEQMTSAGKQPLSYAEWAKTQG